MFSIQICLFGRFTVNHRQALVIALESAKEQELLSYLLIHHDRPHARETLAAMLWGENTTEKSKKYLRQALWHVQTAFASVAEHFLAVEHDWVQFNMQPNVEVDVTKFEQAFLRARDVPGRQLDESAADELRQAVETYRGGLLCGCYQDWCLLERERYQNMYLMILDKLLNYCAANHLYEAGQNYGELILRHDCAHERAHRRLMRLHYLAGDRTAALRQYERCANVLRDELGVIPDTHTENLYRQICAAHTRTAPTANAAVAPTTPNSMAEVLSRLKIAQQSLSLAEQTLRREIKAIEDGLTASKDCDKTEPV